MKKKIIILILIIIFIGLLVYAFKPKPNLNEITLFGNVEIRQIDLSFKVSGQIKDMLYEEGDSVKTGDLVAILDDIDYKANYEQSSSEVEANKAKAEDALLKYNRHKPLCVDGTTSKQECENLLNTKNAAQATYEASVAAKQYNKNQLDYTRIYAPSDGIIMVRIQEPGSMVNPVQPIYTIAKTTPIWIRTYVSETDLGNIKYGMKAKVLTDSIDPKTGKKREYTGWIGYISPVAEFTPKTVQTEELRTDLVYRIRVYIYEVDEFLRQGMPTTIKIGLNETEYREDVDK